MRLTDDRYSHQKHRLEIALRMIRHEARTSTIRQCTGLSEDRIRKLYRTYFSSGSSAAQRKRGKAPQQIYCLVRNIQTRLDSTFLAGIFNTGGVLDTEKPLSSGALSIAVAERICDAYELFAKLRPAGENSDFTFEHAWFLARSLADGTEIVTAPCPRCAGLTIHDRYSIKRPLCPLCEIKRQADFKSSRRCTKDRSSDCTSNDARRSR